MKRNVLRGVLIAMGILAFLGGLFGCNRGPSPLDGEEGSNGIGDKAKDNTSGIVSFRYSYDGSIGGNNYAYEVKLEDGKVLFTYESMEHWDYGEMTCEVPADVLAGLEAIYREFRLATWDGYSKYNSWVSDGEGFSVSIGFADGASMSAHGTNAFPKGYRDVRARFDALFAPFVEQLLEAQRQAKIAEGIHGELSSVMFTIVQHGESGHDEYHVLLTREGVRTYNFDVRVQSRSGEYLPVGEYSVYRSVPDEVLDFPAIQAMVEQYGLIGWYAWDKAAEDYNNAEWFQISFGFAGEGDDEGMTLNAMGSEHPEGYDGFRHAFLTWLAAKVLEVQALPE